MARAQGRFVCQSCGTVTSKWSGKCDGCGEWNTLAEEAAASPGPFAVPRPKGGGRLKLVPLDGPETETPRLKTGINELDRVAGGGIVPGSALLVGGDPGIGKSTIVLQALAHLAAQGHRVIYVSGEEAIEQVRLRARRLGLANAPVELAAETSLSEILAALEKGPPPRVVVVDSIQTMYVETIESAPGSVGQVRAAAHELVRFAKRTGTALILIGHVTKDGQIAGPRVVEHMVDAVLYFEGERGHQFRILRGVKNRFGATDEIGVFEMTDAGLKEVANPSALFLTGRAEGVSGSAVFAGVEGTRPVLVEVQALVGPEGPASPRRAVVGADGPRLAMLLAVLEARCGLRLSGRDVYLNIAGGLKVQEPALDLAAAAALVSSLTGVPLPADLVIFGEVGLSGEVRAVAQSEARLKEAQKLGFARAVCPSGIKPPPGFEIDPVDRLADLVARLAAQS